MKCINKIACYNLWVVVAMLVWALLPPVAQAGADSADIPRPLGKALAIYKKGGTEGFISALVKGGPLEGNQEIHMQVLVLEKMEKYYGAYQSFQILHVNRLSDTTRLIYFLMNYQKGPVFGKLTAYRNGDQETITSFRFHTKAEKIFPEALLFSH
jgi:hypothetical protein